MRLAARALLAGGLLLATVCLEATAQRADPVRLRELARAVDMLGEFYGEPSETRRLATPSPVVRGPGVWRPLVGDPAAARASTLASRAGRRAYDGAPPVMPHSRAFVATKTCLDCHETGMWLGERFGPPLSHPRLASCMQCHVESENRDLPWGGVRVENAFDGLAAPSGGTRAWPGAPPVMPHPTMMRNDCLSCHGDASYPGLRIDHPQRSACLQCHAPAATLDQTSPFFTGEASLLRRGGG